MGCSLNPYALTFNKSQADRCDIMAKNEHFDGSKSRMCEEIIAFNSDKTLLNYACRTQRSRKRNPRFNVLTAVPKTPSQTAYMPKEYSTQNH